MTDFLVGGYTADSAGRAAGIGLARSRADGRLDYLGVVARAESPSWLLVSDDSVFAASESTGDLLSFRMSGARLEPTGRVSTRGELPCHLALAATIAGEPSSIVASSYGSGTVSWHPVDRGVARPPSRVVEQTGFGPHPDQGSARAHASLPLPDGRVLVADLGADRVFVYAPGGATRLGAVELPPGTGPRDIRMVDDGRVLLLGELDGTVHTLDVASDVPTLTASVRLPGVQPRTHAAGIAIDRGIAHVGLRRANRIAAVDLRAGALEPLGDVDCGGDWPRHVLAIDGMLHVSNQLSDSLASFALEPGELPVPLGTPTSAPSPSQLVSLDGVAFEGLESLVA